MLDQWRLAHLEYVSHAEKRSLLTEGGGTYICETCIDKIKSGRLKKHFEEKDQIMEVRWTKTVDKLPVKPGLKDYEYIDCWIYINGEVLKRPWNCEHECWDDESYDDFEFHSTEPSHWLICDETGPQPQFIGE